MSGINPAALTALLRGDFENAVVASTPGGIVAQEKAGQAMLVASASLPKDIKGNTRADFESLGFKFGADVDDIFVTCDLPAGWYKKATDHDMWSEIYDDKHRVRVAVFYKAAFYDRHADMRLVPRYSVQSRDDEHYLVRVIGDEEPRVFGEAVKFDQKNAREIYHKVEQLEEQARSWLNENKPDWKNPLAYWD